MTDEELAREARTAMAKACADYADAYERPGIVTGFVVAYEMTEAGGNTCWWLTGTGADPTEDDEQGLSPHRVLGMLRYTTLRIEEITAS